MADAPGKAKQPKRPPKPLPFWRRVERWFNAAERGYRAVHRALGPVLRATQGPMALRVPVPLPPLAIPGEGHCVFCGARLPAGKKRWCSDICRSGCYNDGPPSWEQRVYLRKIGIELPASADLEMADRIINASDQRRRSFQLGTKDMASESQASYIRDLQTKRGEPQTDEAELAKLTMQDASLMISRLKGEEI